MGPVAHLEGVPGVVHSPFLRAGACGVSLARSHSPVRSAVHGPDVQVWAGPAGRPAWARPALSCRMLGRRDQLDRDVSCGPLRPRVCTPGAGAVPTLQAGHGSLLPAPCQSLSHVLWFQPGAGILFMLSIPSCCCCKGDWGEPRDSDEGSTGIQPMHQP